VTPVALDFLKGRYCGIIVTDQGSQFTSEAFIVVLAGEGIAIRMDGAWTARSGRSRRILAAVVVGASLSGESRHAYRRRI